MLPTEECPMGTMRPGAVLPRPRGCGVLSSWREEGVDVLLSGLAAAATALLLALIARDDIGMPPDMIREDALLGAGLVIAAIAGMSLRKRRQ
jgi:hypothetical protein